jgi:NAD(P)-dependent dehydrogenase (short-subunit alcohol dehydrogenase family)
MTTKIALITGANRGLGKSAALHLAEKGIDLVVTHRSGKDEADAVVKAIRAMGRRASALELDVSDTKTFGAFAEKLRSTLKSEFGCERFDYLVNNAGHGVHASFTDTTEEQLDGLMNVHLKGPFFLTQRLVPMMNDGGSILNVSTGLARFTFPGYSAYAAMKGAVEVLTRYQAKELGARQIRVNTIAPGAIATDFGGGAVRDNADLQAMISGLAALGRVGQPDDIGRAVAALLAGDLSWVTGERVEASGGMLL